MTRNTKRADRKALVEAGTRYHAAKLAHLYGVGGAVTGEAYFLTRAEIVHAAECYVVGRRKASVEHGHRFYNRSKKA